DNHPLQSPRTDATNSTAGRQPTRCPTPSRRRAYRNCTEQSAAELTSMLTSGRALRSQKSCSHRWPPTPPTRPLPPTPPTRRSREPRIMDFDKAITALLDQTVIGTQQCLPAVDRGQGSGDIDPVGGDVVGLFPGLPGEEVLLLAVADLAEQDQ